MKKALTIGENISDNFYFEFIEEVLEKIPDWHISVLTVPEADSPTDREAVLSNHGCTVKYYYNKTLRQRDGKMYRFFRGIKRTLAHLRVKDYDVVVINGVSVFSSMLAFAVSRGTRIVVAFYGSDLLRAGKGTMMLLWPLFRRADAIVLPTRYMADYFSKIYHGRFDNRAMVTSLGMRAADDVYAFAQSHTKEECKKQYGFPADKLCIFCGYNGYRAQRHIEIVRLLETLPKECRDQICLVFHCAYGLDGDYRAELEALCAGSNIVCRLLTDFLTGDSLAALRMCADVMLNLQPTDAFASSMLESMEAGAIAVKGDWLVYPELEAHGAYLLSIPSMEALPELIQDIVENTDHYLEKTKQNRGVVLLKSWETVRGGWMKALGINQ